MLVMLVLMGLLLFGGYAGVTGRFVADSRDPGYSLFGGRCEPEQERPHAAGQLAPQPGARPVVPEPVEERRLAG
jgi:hypothetical protein